MNWTPESHRITILEISWGPGAGKEFRCITHTTCSKNSPMAHLSGGLASLACKARAHIWLTWPSAPPTSSTLYTWEAAKLCPSAPGQPLCLPPVRRRTEDRQPPHRGRSLDILSLQSYCCAWRDSFYSLFFRLNLPSNKLELSPNPAPIQHTDEPSSDRLIQEGRPFLCRLSSFLKPQEPGPVPILQGNMPNRSLSFRFAKPGCWRRKHTRDMPVGLDDILGIFCRA
jgi:hypothetical protein